ncbi:hypothetical protein I8752_13030 [Nostocaceae cyanobacterium CENA369]|uniref:Uncharacterized protein n=1 Tax=Dendronalium phyllosphericum CENA369 TaxID=1725256 RepID=A0A8J7I7L4_9NOST|nr:hypothetical protein [Dendronalium phyllosphericum]MBH8573927.1 hypothetical protein [Dendronalium phyllosphericum CENA369]
MLFQRCLRRATPTHLLFRRTHLLFWRTHLLFRRTHLLFRRTHLLFWRSHLLQDLHTGNGKTNHRGHREVSALRGFPRQSVQVGKPAHTAASPL